MNTSELLHSIAKDRIEGLETIDNYQLRPIVVRITSAKMQLDLNNDIYILNTNSLPANLTTLSMISSDNIFQVTKAEYNLMDEYRYQSFADYIEVDSETDGDFVPYRLEFVKIIPHRKK